MDKIKIGVAAFMVMVLTAGVRAEEILDFDGAAQSKTFMVLRNDLPEFQMPIPTPNPAPAGFNTGQVLYEFSRSRRQALSKAIASEKYLVQHREVGTIIEDTDVRIMYDSEKVFFVREDQGGGYMILLENRDKRLVGLVQGLNAPKMAHTKWNPEESFGMCKDYVVKEICINKQVCKIVATGAGSAIGGVPGAMAGAAVSQTICEWVPSCSDVQVCVAWY